MSQIKFVPRYTHGQKGRSVNIIRGFLPTLACEYEFEDLLQEAYIVFLKCKKKYSNSDVDNQAWFNALFSSALNRRLCTLCQKLKKYNSIVNREAMLENTPEPADHTDRSFMAKMLAEMPADVRKLLDLFLAPAATQGQRRTAGREIRTWYRSRNLNMNLELERK